MKQFKESITKVERGILKAWVEKLSNGKLDAVKNMAIRMLKEREKSFWENPPDDYWRDVEHSCGHSQRYLFSLKDNSEIDSAASEIMQFYCIDCLYKKLGFELIPELIGVSLKQKEFARVVRVYTVSVFLNHVSNIKLKLALPILLRVQQSSWWIASRTKTLEELIGEATRN
jgi:hypothetical protein